MSIIENNWIFSKYPVSTNKFCFPELFDFKVIFVKQRTAKDNMTETQ